MNAKAEAERASDHRFGEDTADLPKEWREGRDK